MRLAVVETCPAARVSFFSQSADQFFASKRVSSEAMPSTWPRVWSRTILASTVPRSRRASSSTPFSTLARESRRALTIASDKVFRSFHNTPAAREYHASSRRANSFSRTRPWLAKERIRWDSRSGRPPCWIPSVANLANSSTCWFRGLAASSLSLPRTFRLPLSREGFKPFPIPVTCFN